MYDLLVIDEMYRLRADHVRIIFTGSVAGVQLVRVPASGVAVARGQVRAVAEEGQVISFEGHVLGWGAYTVAGAWREMVGV